MARTLLTAHADALAECKALCSARRFRAALNLLRDGGGILPTRNDPGQPQTGGFYLRPSDCDGDADLEAFRAWARGQSFGVDSGPLAQSEPTQGALQCDFGAGGQATRDWTGALP